jgi:hypothetical protein
MASYAIIQNNEIINVCEWDGETPFSPGAGMTLTLLSALPAGATIGWTLSGSVWSAPTSPGVDLSATITFLQFMALFTPAEQAALIGSNDTTTKIFVAMATGSGGMQLSNPEVIGGVNYVASIGIITTQRAAQVLAGQAPP